MERQPARTLLLLPEPIAEELLRLAHDWVAAWVADPFLVVVLGDGSVGPELTAPDVVATIVGRDGSIAVDLLDELGERPTDLLRVVAVSVADDLLGTDGAAMRSEATRVERMLQRSASTHNRVSAINLVVPETAANSLDRDRLLVPKWDVNVLASTENRTELRAFDAFVRRSRPRDLQGFVLAHALTVGGLWSGMASAPYDGASPRRANDGIDLQRISVRGVLAQDFMVQMARSGLDLLVQEETPLRDPTIRSQLLGQQARDRLMPVADERVDEAVALLTAYVLDGVDGQPLRYRAISAVTLQTQKLGAWESLRRFGRFSCDKFMVMPTWAMYEIRTGLQRRTGRTLHGEGGVDLIETAQHPFGDAAEFDRDVAEALALRSKGLEVLAAPPAVTAAGPDTYAHLWGALRQGAFRLLDGGAAHEAAGLEATLAERKLDGTLPNTSLICPDAREPWSPHSEVAALVEAETRDLPLTVGWLEVDDASRWSDVLEALAVTYDERVSAVEAAAQHVNRELVQAAESIVRAESDLAAVDALLVLDEHTRGPILDARIDAALAGIATEFRARLLPQIQPPSITDQDEAPAQGPDEAPDDGPDAAAAGDAPDEPSGDEPMPPPTGQPVRGHASVPAPEPAFDRDAAEAWRIVVEHERHELSARRISLGEQAEQLAAEREMLLHVHPVVTEDLLTLRAWRWRLERSFAGRLVHALDGERSRLEADRAEVEDRLRRERQELEPAGNLYRRFVRRMAIGLVVATLLARFLWKPILRVIGFEYGEQSALVAGYLGVPAYPFIVLFVAVVLWALITYHRAWSQRHRDLDVIRHELRQLPGLVQHVQQERLRAFELQRQVRELLRLMSEVIHRPFLLDGIGDSLPSSRSLDPQDLPKIVRFARPDLEDGWSGEARFVQRILKAQFRPGWRSDAYARLLRHVQAQHGVVRGELDAQRADSDPVVRTAIVEHLLLDSAQREAGIDRVREVLDDILNWSVEIDFPYPKVRVVRVERDPLDVRTDMFDVGEPPAEDWQQFLSADVAADERWAPLTFAPGHRQSYMGSRDRIVHAPPRLHAQATGATVGPRPDEVRPAEMVIRIDILPEAVPTARFGVFAQPTGDEDDARGEGQSSVSEHAAASLAAEGHGTVNATLSGAPEDDEVGFNF